MIVSKVTRYIFSHIALAVKDVKESVDFYQKVFELEEIPNSASNSKTRWLSMGDGLQLHLIPRPKAKIKIVKAVHFAISTDDLEGFIRHLDALSISFSDWQDQPNEIYVRQDGIRQIYFQDPNDYWVEVNDDV